MTNERPARGETPMTDACELEYATKTANVIGRVPSDFARQLERALGSERERVEFLKVELEECKHRNGISDREIKLEERIAALEADKKRMDWLENWKGNVFTAHHADNPPWKLYADDDKRHGSGSTLRAAIDAAMKEGK